MTHNRDHIVIHSLKAGVSFGAAETEHETPKSVCKLWHLIVALLFAGIAVGLSVASAI